MQPDAPAFDSFAGIIDAFGGPVPFGTALNIPASHARTMKARDAIQDIYWLDLVTAARKARIVGISYELLARLAARRRPMVAPRTRVAVSR